MMTDPIFDVSGAVAALNQTFEGVYPTMTIVGELSSFRISKGRWVYADIKDEYAKLRCFGTIYQLPGPIEDGMMIEVIAEPRLHPQFGFSLNIKSIRPVGEGSIKKAANLLQEKLEKEGLFAPERKRFVPRGPARIGLVASEQSAAYGDFVKILNARWVGVEVKLYNVQVQGESAPDTIISGLQYFNQQSNPPEVLVMIRGGGSADDLSAFSTEQVVRAVAGSRIPTVVAIGHEVDISLAELAADLHASTPSNAAELLFPDKKETSAQLEMQKKSLSSQVSNILEQKKLELQESKTLLSHVVESALGRKSQDIKHALSLLESVHPKATLKRGYALIESEGKLVTTVSKLKKDMEVKITLHDGESSAKVQ